MKKNPHEAIKSALEFTDLNTIKPVPAFISITRTFLSSEISKELRCPLCGASLDFANGMEWVGPDSFTCQQCEQLINIRLVLQALRDLGVE
jgi:transposase-like protein